MTDRTALLVTGSRAWRDWSVIRQRLSIYPRGTILLHGAARGADTIADRIGLSLGFNVWPLPYFGDLKRAGGHKRNHCLVELLGDLYFAGFRCYVEAFPIGDSPGTRGCLTFVERKIASVRQEPNEVVFTVHVEEGRLAA